jgi:magnesium-dependent phosphatase 1
MPVGSYTLWNFYIDSHIEAPLKQDSVTGVVYDSAPEPSRVEFFEDVPGILCELKSRIDVTVTVASRTFAPKL